ncbi:hypothetical protein RclHR1_00250034 [Rhizophagus clarus]|uniref:C2H2-type domain-containing protein n=1 Tax=Rhizophagus clarus TaxID=94130 RepID=A0A2Z6RT02_9GLOM|nr:hypothetical protein RclHR1_00250034 [Rhizophagus clarus]GET00976.1 hypothetical protein GLOIN_2v1619806 [Rhizophagus clarus]
MSFVRKKQDIFGLTLNDSIWRNQEKPSLRTNNSNDSIKRVLNQNLTPDIVSPVKHDNSCFQYGFPSLFELNEIYSYHQTSNQSEMREINRGFSYLGINHILTNHQEIRRENSIHKKDTTKRFQDNNQFYSLFHYDLLFNKMINKKKLVSQDYSCCPFLDLSESSCEIQRQNDTKRDDDFSYVRSIIPEKPSLEFEIDNKTVHSSSSLKDKDGRLNVPSRVNHDNNFMTTKSDDKKFNDSNRIIELMNHSNKSVDNELNELGNTTIPNVINVTMPKGNTVQQINSNEKLNDYNFKSQPSTLTVEKVQRILEFYHSTSNDFIFDKEIQDNHDYSSNDEKESINNVNFFDIGNVKLLKCTQCDKEFSDKTSREKHINNDHKFICKISNKVSFHAKHEEKVHDNYIKKKPKRRSSRQTKRRRNPGTVRTYSCCGQIFRTGREFGIHKSTHKYMGNRRNVNARF